MSFDAKEYSKKVTEENFEGKHDEMVAFYISLILLMRIKIREQLPKFEKEFHSFMMDLAEKLLHEKAAINPDNSKYYAALTAFIHMETTIDKFTQGIPNIEKSAEGIAAKIAADPFLGGKSK